MNLIYQLIGGITILLITLLVVIVIILVQRYKSPRIIETENTRKRGRPGGPTGKYRINGMPVFEEEYQKWASRQRLIERRKRKNGIIEGYREKLSALSLEELEELNNDTEYVIALKKKYIKGHGINNGNEYKRCKRCDKSRLIRWFRIIRKGKTSDYCLICERNDDKLKKYSDRKTGWVWEGNIPYLKK